VREKYEVVLELKWILVKLFLAKYSEASSSRNFLNAFLSMMSSGGAG